MADPIPGAEQTSSASVKHSVKAAKSARPPNPIWKMMELPNMRLRLPSRNWMIFFTISGSFSAAVIYDKREKRRAQRKWSKLVEHLALEPIDPRSMPRRLTVYLEGPPTDGLRVAQDHFKEYVKPIMVSSGLDWEFVQGRKEGDVRAEIAERIRKFRTPTSEVLEEDDTTLRIRRQNKIEEFDGPKGDIVIGRHTWKEYVRGLHEGWLGPLSPPKTEEPSEEEQQTTSLEGESPIADLLVETVHSSPADSDRPPADDPAPEIPPETAAEKTKKPPQPPPFISVSAYPSAPSPPNFPPYFDPSVPINFPHILGFLNTPLRLYRFLNRRQLADSIGRETAAIILSTYRPYHSTPTAPSSSISPLTDGSPIVVIDDPQLPEQATALVEEEREWHKTAFKRVEGEPERTWLEEIALDPRIAVRMRRAELTLEDEARAASIVVPEEEIEGWIKGSLRGLWRSNKHYIGLGPKEKPVGFIGDEDVD